MGSGCYERAQERSFSVIGQWENSNEPIAAVLLYTAYSNLAYIDMFLYTASHKYNAPKYLKKKLEYFERSSVTPKKSGEAFTVGSIRSFACTIGEGASLSEFDKFIQSVRESAFYIAQTPEGIYSGYEDLVACEIAFFKNQLETAKSYAHSAILKARDKKQYSIEAMARHYLLRAAVFEGDGYLIREILKQLRVLSDNPDFWYHRMLYDLFTGQFYIQVGLPDLTPAWLIADEKETDSGVHIPGRELGVKIKYYIAVKKYDRALTALNDFYPIRQYDRLFFGMLAISLLTAAVRCGTGDTAGAVRDFEKAYELSFCGEFEMFFIELGKELHPLVTAALTQTDCNIPEEWLRAIDRKASIYAKKAAVIKSSVEKEENIKETFRLSERERTVLNDLYHGLSRDDVAANRYISINTVNKSLQSVFIKLNAGNIIDAVRIALENKLIE